MASATHQSKAHIILEAVRLSSNAEITPLGNLAVRHPGILKLDLVLRILLTFLPESIEPELYIDFLGHLIHDNIFVADQDAEIDLGPQHEISELEARQRVRQLHLLPVAEPGRSVDESMDVFTLFILHRASRIDAETGSIPLVARLVEPFLDHSTCLRTWAVSTLLPILRLDYEYYPNDGPPYSLESFRSLRGSSTVQSLLSKAAQPKREDMKSDIGRDIRGLVGPWMYGQNINKRRKIESRSRRRSSVGVQGVAGGSATHAESFNTDSWADVNDWLVDLATRDHTRAVEAVEQWDGPRDVDYGGWASNSEEVEDESSQASQVRYGQAGLSTVYATTSATLDTILASHRVLCKITKLLNLRLPPDLDSWDSVSVNVISHYYVESLSSSHLLHNALLRTDNPLTTPTDSAIALSYFLLVSSSIFQSYGYPKSCRNLLDLAIFSSEGDQLAELRKLLHTIQSTAQGQQSWGTIRDQILWLQDWGYRAPTPDALSLAQAYGLFCKISSTVIEKELLKAMLASAFYSLPIDVYCKQATSPLPKSMVEKTVIDVALVSYDGASNGNRNRGGLRKASEIISAFKELFPDSQAFERLSALLAATHSMSYYSLTLQHGVPFQPVNIRAHQDPMLLVGKILEQNARSYTKLDDLLDIGQNLVAAGLLSDAEKDDSDDDGNDDEGTSRFKMRDGPENQALLARRRITGMAIDAALRENDFDTAYSYVINRLSPQTPLSSSSTSTSDSHDDISWRAAYNAGCYKPPTQRSSPSSLRRLEQRMELLSQALLLAPPQNLTEILTVWAHCEDDLNVLLTHETAAEESWNTKGDRHIPGGFSRESVPTVQKSREPSRAAMNEEAPMGLFDVARGAASALSKNAFPLRSPRLSSGTAGSLQSPHERTLSKMGSGASDSGSGTDAAGEGRVRKRDMVSNMVTGGLASGIGWVIGAPSVKSDE